MFGLNDNTDKNAQPAASNAASGLSMPPLNTSVGSGDQSNAIPPGLDTAPPSVMPSDSSATSTSNSNAASSSPAPSSPGGGISDVNLENAYIPTAPAPSASSPPDSTTTPTAASLLGGSDDDLLKLKQQALQSLAPLVDHLDQTPEEKFKTTMMLIQASDNVDLIPEAYEAAGKIEDEKIRAQALLDVVNEINYFTQHNKNSN